MHAISGASWKHLLLLAVSLLRREFESCFRFISFKGKNFWYQSHMPDILLLGLRWVLHGCVREPSSTCGSTSSCGAVLEAELGGGRKQGDGDLQGWHSGLGTFSWRHLAPWTVPSAPSPCATAGAFSWCDSHSPPCPFPHPSASSKVSFKLSLGSVTDTGRFL